MLTEILLYHVADQKLMANEYDKHQNPSGQRTPCQCHGRGVFVGKAKVIVTDVNASNGVIHVIDTVLIPPEKPSQEKDIIGTAKAAGNFTTLLTALNATNLSDTLKGEGPYTVFAPTDEAFAALPSGTKTTLLNNTDMLTEILLYHVADQKLMANDVVNMTSIKTLQGSELPVNITDQGVFVGNAQIVMQDVNASNGVIHVIDAVLIPPEKPPQEKDIIGTAGSQETSQRFLQRLTPDAPPLKGEGPFTVFAPTDEAFAALPNGTIEALLNDTSALKKILLYHVAGQKLMAKDVVNMSNVTTLQGSELPSMSQIRESSSEKQRL